MNVKQIFHKICLILIAISNLPSCLFARGGIGGGGAGGGIHGGAHFGSHSNQMTNAEGQGFLIFICFSVSTILFVFGFIWYLIYRRKKDSHSVLISVSKNDKEWDEMKLKEYVLTAYNDIQMGWSKREFYRLKKRLTKELYEEWKTKIELDEILGIRNIVAEINVKSIDFVNIVDRKKDAYDSFIVSIKVGMIDIYINNDNKMKSDNSGDCTEYWQFVRQGKNWLLCKVYQDKLLDKAVLLMQPNVTENMA